MDVLNEISRYFSSKGHAVDPAGIAELRYIDAGWVDSMSMLDFVLHLEQHFGIRFDDELLVSEQFQTLGGVAEATVALSRNLKR